jgi:ribonuclease Z
VIGPCRRGRKLIYTGDTRPCETVIKASKNVDVLIHDGTLAQEKADWARESLHSTAKEAAEVAQKAGVKRLILTHISSRYTDDSSVLLEEAKEVFENTCVADDLMEFEVLYGE